MTRALVVIPARNEAATIFEVASKASAFADVLVVDDGSTDGTGEIVKGLPGCSVLRHEASTHIPEAIRDGFRWALKRGYGTVVTMDAGMSHDPAALPELLAQPPADLVLSYRREALNVPWWRRALTAAAARMVGLAVGGRYRNVTSGYRRYSWKAMEEILSTTMVCRSFDFHFEALAVIRGAGLTVGEFPITYRFTNSSLDGKVVRQALSTWWRIVRGRHRR